MMKKIYTSMAVIILLGAGVSPLLCEPKTVRVAAAVKNTVVVTKETSAPKSAFKPFFVYRDQGSRDNHFLPYGLMGDISDMRIEQGCTENPHSGKYCIKITYEAGISKGAGWIGVYWQQPANNWDGAQKGYNLTGAQRLTFYARGAKGGEKVAEFKIGGINIGNYSDSDSSSFGPVELTNVWQKYTIDLKGRNLSNIIGGFCWSTSKDLNPEGFIIYLDDIVYE